RRDCPVIELFLACDQVVLGPCSSKISPVSGIPELAVKRFLQGKGCSEMGRIKRCHVQLGETKDEEAVICSLGVDPCPPVPVPVEELPVCILHRPENEFRRPGCRGPVTFFVKDPGTF